MILFQITLIAHEYLHLTSLQELCSKDVSIYQTSFNYQVPCAHSVPVMEKSIQCYTGLIHMPSPMQSCSGAIRWMVRLGCKQDIAMLNKVTKLHTDMRGDEDFLFCSSCVLSIDVIAISYFWNLEA